MNTYGAKVLVVDDEPRNLKLISVRLRADGYEVLTADNGAEAIETAQTTCPDVILLDIMMPGMDGYEVIKRLKKDFDTHSIPIVLVSALHAVEDRVKGLNAGADDFLTKPIDANELLARVRSLAKISFLEKELRLRIRIEKQSVSPAVTTDDKSILLIEDDHKMTGYMKDMLSGAGYTPVVTGSGRKSLDLLETTAPALIILDPLLPDMDGFELLKQLKHRKNTKDIPILIVSSLSESRNRVKGLDMGADDYLIKPVNKRELIARIEAALRRSAQQKLLESELQEMYTRSITDSLTGLHNRQYLYMHLQERLHHARRYQRPFSLLMIDIDDFKHINDTYGHLTGDEILKQFANT